MAEPAYQPGERRPLASRQLAISQRMAAWLIARDVSPNSISGASVIFAALACGSLVATASASGWTARVFFALGAIFVQARLLANLFDGMVAVGSGKASPLGELYNEVPDRISDPLILVGLGFAAGGSPALGWLAGLLALFTAYVRALGGVLGVKDLFIGPMAKPQRMATVTAVCVYCLLAPGTWPGSHADGSFGAARIGLVLIVLGAAITVLRRLHRIASCLRV
jgi:phosphatidylglycerophosphate synthase